MKRILIVIAAAAHNGFCRVRQTGNAFGANGVAAGFGGTDRKPMEGMQRTRQRSRNDRA